MTDQNFDNLAERFTRRLYGKPKGQLRLQLVCDGLLADCKAIGLPKQLRVLDMGCGLGQMAELLSSHGHAVIACDTSAVMLESARRRIALENPACLEGIHFVHSPLQQLSNYVDGQFDLIIFHAVLEWLEAPQLGLMELKPWLKPNGELSLLFYNLHGLLYRNLLRGDFRHMEALKVEGEAGGLTPKNPLDPAQVSEWLAELKLAVISRRGIRCFYDFMVQGNTEQRLAKININDVLAMEQRFSQLDPYRGLARYQLWHCNNSSAD
jgi:S-adenosylmethionine-dependent methyltransferase